ncbi:MarR family winged helix-turn-helix transcriptional regulator [Actinoplanes philippinensis]|uniref:MarR family winged helix-turn-helix transcriptional regulator n=1 Tax=Actinoplanes philippinensis TaxID=35752 RepID=UPI0033E5B77D
MSEELYAPARIRVLPSWLLGRAAAHGHRLVAQALAGEGVRMMHHAVLASVAELGPVSQADLARVLRVDPKDMVATLRELRRHGWVTSTPDPADRRKNAIAITPAGTGLLHRTERLGDQANARLTAALTPAERDQLTHLLGRILAHAAATEQPRRSQAGEGTGGA